MAIPEGFTEKELKKLAEKQTKYYQQMAKRSKINGLATKLADKMINEYLISNGTSTQEFRNKAIKIVMEAVKKEDKN